jgi:hypothetical protein
MNPKFELEQRYVELLKGSDAYETEIAIIIQDQKKIADREKIIKLYDDRIKNLQRIIKRERELYRIHMGALERVDDDEKIL